MIPSKQHIEEEVRNALLPCADKTFQVEALIEEEDGEVTVAVDVIGLHRDIVEPKIIELLSREGMKQIEAIDQNIIEPESGVRIYSVYEQE